MADEFERSLAKAEAVVDGAAKRATGVIAGAIFRELAESTKVDTGRTRGHWTVGAGSQPLPSHGVFEFTPEGAPSPRERTEAEAVEFALARLPIGTPAIVSNSLPHASLVTDSEAAIDRALPKAEAAAARLLDGLSRL